jgi:hypothetical protein
MVVGTRSPSPRPLPNVRYCLGQVAGEPARVAFLQGGVAPVVAGDGAAAGRRPAGARPGSIGHVEQGVVGGQLLTGGDVPHGGEHHVAGEPDVGLARVVDEQHHRLVLLLGQRHEVKALGDLDIGVLQHSRKRLQRPGVDDVTALDGDHLPCSDLLHREQTSSCDAAGQTLAGFRRDPGSDDGHGNTSRDDGRAMVTIEQVRELALTLPRAYEALVRDHVKFRVGRIVWLAFARDETMMGFAFPKDERQALIDSEPDKFLMPKKADQRYNWVVVRLDAIDEDEMREIVLDAWRMVVPKSVAVAHLGDR